MGFFDFMKGKEKGQPAAPAAFPTTLGAPAKGSFVPMEQIPDEVFSAGVLGICCGVDPAEGKVYAPMDGKITQVADTLHAIGIAASGAEVLIHVGVDTVDMNGDGFSGKVKVGQRVKKGDLLLTMDLEKIKAAGHPATVILAVTNTDDLAAVKPAAEGPVQPGDAVLSLKQLS